MENLSGHIVKGYELRERIGAGGFGAVYRASQSTVGREVAVKIILPHFTNHPDFIRRFETEAHLIARLEHLHIIPLYDYWRDPDGAYLVMRWLRGGSLRDALQQNGPYDLESAALLLDQIASALASAHRSSVIHRDLKPGNILLDEDGNAYLADFGIAKDLGKSGITELDAIIGSPDYIAPEQARSELVTPQTDIYSLGVVLYEILTGAHPFPNLTAVERMYKHLNDPLPEIPDMPAGVNAVIQKATAKNPAHRYSDALALAVAFREAALPSQTSSSLVESLTQREQEILQGIIDGKSNKDIANELFVTLATVKWYIKQIYAKLRVRGRVQAIVRARELNLIVGSSVKSVSGSDTISSQLIEPENPYKGLRAFQSADNRDFFGRESLVEKLVKRLGESRFLAVVGPSGSGKSSLVKAGLIPALWRGEIPGSDRWFMVEMLPGSHPLDELEIALLRVAANQSSSLKEQLDRDDRGLLRVAQLILPDDGSELFIVIDQFEEIFTLVEDESARQHFLNILHTAVTDPRSRVRVVITLRADFYDRPLHFPEFGELVRSRMETVLPLGANSLERAIAKPAEQQGIKFEEGLVASIISEVNYQPGALPLLQYTLTELFERRQGRLLTHDAYREIGGTVGALARRADEIYGGLDDIGKEAARQMFLRLVTLGEGVEDTRRRVARSELMAVADDEDLMDDIIDTFAGYRLLSLDNDPGTRAPTVEVAHEAILREWERLRAWLNSSRDEIRIQRQLANMAAEWREAKQDASFLARGSRLEQFEKWMKKSRLALTPDERAYLDASITHRQDENEAETQRKAREIRLERRSQTFLRGLVAVLLLATLGAFALTGVAVSQSNSANRNAELSQSLALASAAQAALAESNVDQALALVEAANQIDRPPTLAQRVLYDAAFEPGTARRLPCANQWCWTMDVDEDKQTLLTGGLAGKIILSDLVTGQPIRTFEGGHTDELQGLAFLPGGQRFLSTGVDDRMILWDVASGQIIRTFESPAGDLMKISVSPDGRLAATASEGGTPIIWNIETGEIVHRLVGHDPSVQVQAVAFSPDGRTLLSGSEDTTLILWDVETGELLRRFEGHTNAVFTVLFSPDGRTALSTSLDNTLILWDVETGELLRRFEGHTNWVFDARFMPDGAHILSASRDQSLILWDIATGNRLHTYVGEGGMALNLRLLSNGTQAVVSYNTGYVRVWQLDAQNVVRQLGEAAPPAEVETIDDTSNADSDILALSADGKWTVTAGAGSEENSLFLWETATGKLLHRYVGHQGRISSVSFNPDQTRLVSTAWDKTLTLWDVETEQAVRRYEGHTAAVFDAAFSPDGHQLLSASEDRTMILWDVETGTILKRFGGFSDSANTVAFSPDGRAFVAGFGTIRYAAGENSDNSLRLFNADSGEEIRRFEGHAAPVTSAVFSADGQTLLSGSTDTTLRLWDVQTGKEIRRFNGHTTAVWTVGYSADGRYAASGSQDGNIIVWNVETGEILRQVKGGQAMVYGVAFIPNQDQLLSAAADGTAKIWRLMLDLNMLLSWTKDNRYVPGLSCSERELYQLSQSCS